MTTRESDKARAAEGGEQERAITRGEEGPILAHDDRVRPVIAKVLGVEEGRIYLTFANEPPYQLERIGIGGFHNLMTPEQKQKAARAGIVPGADGWCWAPTPQAPTPTRAEQVRQALLAVLSRGPITTGTATLLPAVEGAMGAPAGSVEGREVREAARTVGAVVSGARWALGEGPPSGWGWARTSPGAATWLLRPHATDQSVAIAYENGGWLCMTDNVTHGSGGAVNLLAAQAAALAAARRAGLFARRVAVEVASDGGLPAVTSQGGEAVVKVAPAPLPSGQALASHIERMVGIREGQSDCSLSRLIEAFAVGIEERALSRTIDHYAAERARMMGGRPEDFRDMSEMGEGPGVEPTPHATVQASLAQRAYAEDAPLLYAWWQAATSAHDAYRAEGMGERFSRNLNALFDVIREREGAAPRDPHPHRDGNEEPWETIERLARSLDETKRELAAMEVHGAEQRDRAKRAERERDEYLSKALASEARESAEHNRRCEAERELAQLQAGLDGLRTWAAGAKGGGK